MGIFRLHWRSFLKGGLLAILVGGFLVWTAATSLVDSFDQASWLPTAATVVESRQVTTRTGEKTLISHRFRYTYEVDGIEHTSKRYSLQSGSGDPSTAVARFSEGDTVTVYYDPDDPSSALVERGAAGVFVYLLGGLGILFLLMGLGLTLADDYELFFHPGEVVVRIQEEKLRQAAATLDESAPETVDALLERIDARLREDLIHDLRRDRKYAVIGRLGKLTGFDFEVSEAIVERLAEEEEVEI